MKRVLNIVALVLTLNTVLIAWWLGLPWSALFITLALAFYIKFHISPRREKRDSKLLRALGNGHEMLFDTLAVTVLEIVAYMVLLIVAPIEAIWLVLLTNGIVFVVLSEILMIRGLTQVFMTSHQLGVAWRAKLLFLGHIPILNLVMAAQYSRLAHAEYIFEAAKHDINHSRARNKICQTKYPILLVHGIFFRDFKLFNYWGRIPAELVRNGAKIYYGGQQSAVTLAVAGAELRVKVQEIMDKEKVDKVNIIAHSKGGLDARYMISKLGMAKHVASLTTISTPHRGTYLVDSLLKLIPTGVFQFVARNYNKLFKKLGDQSPDFYASVKELSKANLAKSDEKLPNRRGVLHQSIGTQMESANSTVLPLSLGYVIINRESGNNDGLVSVESTKHGKYIGTLTSEDKRGVGHGDVVDLTRQNLRGFDVREFYVKLVADLRKKGL